jgi:hypothetical protein
VALPEQPAFRYRLPERWLELTPPSVPVPSSRGPVRLPLAALDTLTQRLLGLQRAERAYGQSAPPGQCPSSDLDPASAACPAARDRAAGLPAAPDRMWSAE